MASWRGLMTFRGLGGVSRCTRCQSRPHRCEMPPITTGSTPPPTIGGVLDNESGDVSDDESDNESDNEPEPEPEQLAEEEQEGHTTIYYESPTGDNEQISILDAVGLIRDGFIADDTQVWADGLEEWVPFLDLKRGCAWPPDATATATLDLLEQAHEEYMPEPEPAGDDSPPSVRGTVLGAAAASMMLSRMRERKVVTRDGTNLECVLAWIDEATETGTKGGADLTCLSDGVALCELADSLLLAHVDEPRPAKIKIVRKPAMAAALNNIPLFVSTPTSRASCHNYDLHLCVSNHGHGLLLLTLCVCTCLYCRQLYALPLLEVDESLVFELVDLKSSEPGSQQMAKVEKCLVALRNMYDHHSADQLAAEEADKERARKQAEQERADAERLKHDLIAWVAEQQVLAAARMRMAVAGLLCGGQKCGQGHVHLRRRPDWRSETAS